MHVRELDGACGIVGTLAFPGEVDVWLLFEGDSFVDFALVQPLVSHGGFAQVIWHVSMLACS